MNRDFYHSLIFDLSRPGRRAYAIPTNGCTPSIAELPPQLMRESAPQLPEVDEPTIVRHYTNLSTNNFGVDSGFYPLGS